MDRPGPWPGSRIVIAKSAVAVGAGGLDVVELDGRPCPRSLTCCGSSVLNWQPAWPGLISTSQPSAPRPAIRRSSFTLLDGGGLVVGRGAGVGSDGPGEGARGERQSGHP